MPTENHDFNTPKSGTENWDVPLNENTVALDTRVEVRDTEANRNDYTPKEGAKFLAIDTGTVYLGDGTEWQELGRIDERATFDAQNYDGAVGGAQIQNALDEAATTDPAVVVVPGDGPDDVSDYTTATRPNAWLIRSALEVPSRTILRFSGAHVFLESSANSNLVRNVAATSGDETRNTDIHIVGDRSTFLNGNATQQDRPTTDEPQTEPGALDHFGILLHKVDRCTVGGFQIGRTAGWGVVVQDFTDCAVRNLDFRQDAAVWNQDGCSFVGPGDRGYMTGLTGTFGDDFATVYGDVSWLNDPVAPGGDVSNVLISDCTVAPASSTDIMSSVRLQTGGGTTITDIVASNLTLNGGYFKLINNNQSANYDDLRGISISNVTSSGAGGGLALAGKLEGVTVTNYQMSDSTDIFFYANGDAGTTVKASARNVHVANSSIQSDGPLFYTGKNGGILEDVTLRDVTYETVDGGDSGARILFYSGGISRNVTFDNVTIDGNSNGEGLYAKPDYTLENVRATNLHFTNVTDGVVIESNSITPPVKFTDVTFGNYSGSKFDVAPDGVVTNGVGRETASAERPTAAKWTTGDVVEFTDSGDGSGDGVYLLLPAGRWSRIGSQQT